MGTEPWPTKKEWGSTRKDFDPKGSGPWRNPPLIRSWQHYKENFLNRFPNCYTTFFVFHLSLTLSVAIETLDLYISLQKFSRILKRFSRGCFSSVRFDFQISFFRSFSLRSLFFPFFPFFFPADLLCFLYIKLTAISDNDWLTGYLTSRIPLFFQRFFSP